MFRDCVTQDVDTACWLLDGIPVSVYAGACAHLPEAVNSYDVDAVSMVLKFPTSMATVEVELNEFSHEHRLEVTISLLQFLTGFQFSHSLGFFDPKDNRFIRKKIVTMAGGGGAPGVRPLYLGRLRYFSLKRFVSYYKTLDLYPRCQENAYLALIFIFCAPLVQV